MSANVPNKDGLQSFKKNCNLCDETFSRNSEFENHMVEKHDVQKTFECSICGKRFLLQWRLKKHGLMHREKTQKCQYFLNNQFCPFDKVGCNFSHDEQIVEEEDDEDYYKLNENQCHLCKEQLTTKDELWEHVERNHVEYFQGKLEMAAANRS